MQFNKRTAIIFLLALLPTLNACGGTPGPTPTPWIIVLTSAPTMSGTGVGGGLSSPTPVVAASTPTTAPADTVAPTVPPAAPSSAPVTLATYTGTGAPFTVQYPSDWTVDSPENGSKVQFGSRDKLFSLLVGYGPGGTYTPETLLPVILMSFGTPAPKPSNQTTNIDGSINFELEYADSAGNQIRGINRVVRQSTSDNFYWIAFSTTKAVNYAQSRALGLALVNSFQERQGIVRQSTLPSIVRPTATSTAIPAAASDTPQPTDTPEPTATIAPRPPAALFRIDAQARGYESWGAPKDGCNSGATGQWDNNHPIKRLTIDLTLSNNSGRPIQQSDVGASMFSDTGAELLICLVSNIPTAAPGGSTSFGLTTFVEKNQFLSAMRVTIFGSSARVCFARNNPPSVVGC